MNSRNTSSRMKVKCRRTGTPRMVITPMLPERKFCFGWSSWPTHFYDAPCARTAQLAALPGPFQGRLQFHPRGEPGHAFRLDLNGAPAAGIPDALGFAVGNSERAKARDGNPVPAHQAGPDARQERLQCARCLRPRNGSVRCDLSD